MRAARARFAAHGYQAATIRAIAADADIDPSMVMRYYGSKADLFGAALQADLRIPDLTGVPEPRLGEVLVNHFLDRWEGDPGEEVLLLLLRSATVDDYAARQMRAMFRTQLVPAITPVLDDSSEASTRAGLIATQMLGLALCRHILRLPPVVGLLRGQLVSQVGPTVQRYLRGPL